MTMPTEMELEKRMLDEGEESFWRAVRRTKDQRVTTRQGAGAVLLARAVDVMAPEIDRWTREAKARPGPDHSLIKYLDRMDPALVAFLSTRVVLDSIAEKRELASVAARIGHRLQDEERLKHLKKEAPYAWARSWKRLSRSSSYRNKRSGFEKEADKLGLLLEPWPTKDRVLLGAFLIEMMRSYTGLIEIVNHREAGRRRPRVVSSIVPTPETLDWLDRMNDRMSGDRPRRYPMVEAPLVWHGLYGGGYHRAELQKPVVLAHRTQLDQLEGALEAGPEEHGAFLRAINVAQAVPWRVNPDMLAVARELWNRGGSAAGMPDRTPPEVPPYPVEGTDTDQRAWRKMVRRMHIRRVEQGSRRITLARQMDVAEELGAGPLYFPHMADFRGRLYSENSAIFPQGDDLARGLLEFNEPGGPLDDESMWWLKVHAANTFGVDKVPFAERVEWADMHLGRMVANATNPIGERWWTEASEPWQFLAAARELVRAERGGGGGSRLPVQIDGSNNGLQVYSMLSKDPESAEATNCTPSDRPQDIYQRVADRTWAAMVSAAEGGDDRARDALRLLGTSWGRKATKRPVMVLPYGGTANAVFRYLREWYEEDPDTRWEPGAGKVLSYVAKVLWSNMEAELPGALSVMSWLRSVATLFAERGAALWWVTPSGFLVRQEYAKRRSGRVKTVMGEVVRFTRYREDQPGTIDARRQANGFPPNYVHSLDASVLHLATERAADVGITNLRLVHDAFATTPDRIGDLAQLVRDSFVDVLEGDPLEELRAQLEAQAPTGAVVPEPPPRGPLDVNVARQAQYLFS